MVAITELDLSNCRPNSIADRINDVPGLKTSTGEFLFFFFFFFLFVPSQHHTLIFALIHDLPTSSFTSFFPRSEKEMPKLGYEAARVDIWGKSLA